MQSTDLKDKLIVDPSEIEGLADLLSRAEPGDAFKVEATLTLDESGEKLATFSVSKPEITAAEDDAEAGTKDAGDDGSKATAKPAASAAAKLFPDNE